MKRVILIAIFCLIVFLPQVRAEEPTGFIEIIAGYENNQHLITGEKVKASFDEAVANIKNQQAQYPDQALVVLITGSADQIGKDIVNVKISSDRAEQVYNKMLFLFPEAQISKVAIGDQDNLKAVKVDYYFLPTKKPLVIAVQGKPVKVKEVEQNIEQILRRNSRSLMAIAVLAGFFLFLRRRTPPAVKTTAAPDKAQQSKSRIQFSDAELKKAQKHFVSIKVLSDRSVLQKKDNKKAVATRPFPLRGKHFVFITWIEENKTKNIRGYVSLDEDTAKSGEVCLYGKTGSIRKVAISKLKLDSELVRKYFGNRLIPVQELNKVKPKTKGFANQKAS